MFSLCVCTAMSAATGSVHEACRPRLPSTSTRQSRQDPNDSRLSVAQSLGTGIPASMAAGMIDVPAGTVTTVPSTVSVTVLAAGDGGVP